MLGCWWRGMGRCTASSCKGHKGFLCYETRWRLGILLLGFSICLSCAFVSFASPHPISFPGYNRSPPFCSLSLHLFVISASSSLFSFPLLVFFLPHLPSLPLAASHGPVPNRMHVLFTGRPLAPLIICPGPTRPGREDLCTEEDGKGDT